MADPAPNNNPNDPNGGGGDGGANPPNPQPNPDGAANVDLTKLSDSQLSELMEKHPSFWNHSRLKELRDNDTAFKKLQSDQATAAEQKLKDDKKFEELATAKEQENAKLQDSIKTMRLDQAITNKLVPEGVVDLDAALKLVDRSKVTVDENGNVTGVEDAIKSLQTDKAYLFGQPNQPRVGSPSNNGQPPSGPPKFKRSQLKDQAFYQEHRKEILEAMKTGLIEDDIS